MRSINELVIERKALKKIKGALEKKIAPLIKQEIIKAVDDVVYSAGTPHYYIRRRSDMMGLQDQYSLVTEIIADSDSVTVNVYNRSEPDHGGFEPLASNIEEGYADRDAWYNKPRPFMSKAQECVNNKANEIVRILSDEVNK